MRTAVLTISTSVSQGRADDASGPLLAALADEAGADVVAVEVLPDDQAIIEVRLRHHAGEGCDLIFTTGGTGLTPHDITPEATRKVIEREAPGFAETMRAEGLKYTPYGILTRGVSGVAGRTLIVNFPGSPRAVRQSWPVVEPTLKHAADTLERS